MFFFVCVFFCDFSDARPEHIQFKLIDDAVVCEVGCGHSAGLHTALLKINF